MLYIITYDVTKDHLRKQVNTILSSFGTRVQKSVFELDLNPDQISYVLRTVAPYIETGDSLRCYPLCENCFEKAKSYNTSPLTRDQPYYFV